MIIAEKKDGIPGSEKDSDRRGFSVNMRSKEPRRIETNISDWKGDREMFYTTVE